jgi:hypothetical protein
MNILLTQFLITLVASMDAPCYGFGKVFGKPGVYATDDSGLVRASRIGGENNYLASLNYFFDGRTFLQAEYRSISGQSVLGNIHGINKAKTSFIFNKSTFNVTAPFSRLTNPALYVSQADQLEAIAFDEVVNGVAHRWLLRSLFAKPLRFAKKYVDPNWTKLSETCLVPSDQKTIIVGIATTKQTATSMDIASIQFEYLSSNADVCSCLSEQPLVKPKNSNRSKFVKFMEEMWQA